MEISYWHFFVTFYLNIFWTTCEEEFNQEGFLIEKQTDIDVFLQYSTAQYARVKIGYCDNPSGVKNPSAYYVFRVIAPWSGDCKNRCDCRISLDYLFQRTYSGKGFLLEFDNTAAKNAHKLYEQRLFYKYTGHILVFRSVAGPGGDDRKLKIEEKLLPSGKQFKCQWGYMFEEKLDLGVGYTRDQLNKMYNRYSETLGAAQKKTGTGYIILDAYHLSHTDPERITGLAWKEKVDLIIYLNDGHKKQPNPAKLKKAIAYFQQGHVKSIMYFLPNRLITRLESILPNIDWSRQPFDKQGSFGRSDIQKYYKTPNSVLEIDAVNCEGTDAYAIDSKCRFGFHINALLEPILVDENIVSVRFLDKLGKPLKSLAKFDFKSVQGPVFYFLKLFPGPNYDQNILLDSTDVIKSFSSGNPILVVGFGEKTGSRKAYDEQDGLRLSSFIEDQAHRGITFGVRLRIDFFASKTGIEWMVDATRNTKFKYLFLHDSTRQGLEVETIGELSKTEVENLQNNINQLDMETYFVAAETVFAGSRIDPNISVTNPPTTTTVQILSTLTKFTRATDDPFIPGEIVPDPISGETRAVPWIFVSVIYQVLLFNFLA